MNDLREATLRLMPTLLLLAGCATMPRPSQPGPDLELRPLSEGVWRHVSFKELPGVGRFPSNGLVVLGTEGVVLVDTPWTPEQTRQLLSWVDHTLHRQVTDVVLTHAHDDRLGGVRELAPEVRIHALPGTVHRALKQGWDFLAMRVQEEEVLTLGGERLEVFFPGAGHAPDNLVVSFPTRGGLLFGGCFVKSAQAGDLGNLEDADLESWQLALQRVQVRFPSAAVIVPGHGEPGGQALLQHTRELVDAALALKSK